MLNLQGVTKRYGELVAVDDLSLHIAKGEVFGLLGPNGAGKTTTVSMCIGLLEPDSGSVSVNGGGSPTDPQVRAGIGVAPQELSIYEELTGEENVAFFARLQGLNGTTRRERVDWALGFVGLTERRGDRVKNYSGGMKRRLNLAIAIVQDPPLLLLDEPTVGVDPQSRNAIFDKIQALKERSITVIYTTHYMEEAERLCDRVGIMDRGKLLALDTVDGLIRAHGGQCVVKATTEKGEMSVATDDPVAELVRLQGEAKLSAFRLVQPNLESVFLNLTGRSLRD